MRQSEIDFQNWIATVRPEDVEPERFGPVDIYRNRFGTQLHKESLRKHEIIKIQRRIGTYKTVEREPRQKKTPKLSPSYLATVREEIKRIKNG